MNFVRNFLFVGLILAAILTNGCTNNAPVKESVEITSADIGDTLPENRRFSDTGAVSLYDGEYLFTVLLVKDLAWAIESLQIADYGLPRVTKIKTNESVTPFLTFLTFQNENVNLTYSVKRRNPDGTFSPTEYNDLPIAQENVSLSMVHPARQFATTVFNDTCEIGTYQFHIDIKDNGNTRAFFIMEFELIENNNSNEFREYDFHGTLYRTTITTDGVSVKDYPSLDGNIILQLNKNDKITIIGVSNFHDGFWLRIGSYNGNYIQGWILGNYANEIDFKPSPIHFEEFIPRTENRVAVLRVSYNLNGRKIFMNLSYPHRRFDNSEQYTFVLDQFNRDFHYSNIPGSYIWDMNTNELRHITYRGTSMESSWVDFTEDFTYFLEDSGTSTGIRGIFVSRMSDRETIFAGAYLRDINLRGHVIEIVYMDHPQAGHDDEIASFFRNFRSQNPIPQEMIQYSREFGFGIDLIVQCDLNFDTGERTILRGRYIHTQ